MLKWCQVWKPKFASVNEKNHENIDNYFLSVTPDQAISSERRQDVSDYDLETLMLREQQLQELLARESELTPAQREELLRQLAAWPGVPDSLPDNSLVCNEEDSEECLGRMLLIENDMPVVNADRRNDFKLVSRCTKVKTLLHITDASQRLWKSINLYFPQSNC